MTDDIKFQYFENNIKNAKPIGFLTLSRFIKAIKNPSAQTVDIFNAIKDADKIGDMKLKQELKSKLYYFTPAVHLNNGRKYSDIIGFSSLAILDFDKLNEDYALEFKKALFDEYKFIIATWLSASSRGVRALVKIPICYSVDEFKHYFNAIELEFNQYNGFDKAPKNCVLPLFMSYDKNIFYRSDYTTWTKKLIPIEKPIIVQYLITDKSSSIEKIAKSAIDKITSNGHPQLRAIAYAIGGYISAGYIDSHTSISILNRLIDSNAYLCQKAEIYKKTAKEMINKGTSQPIYLT